MMLPLYSSNWCSCYLNAQAPGFLSPQVFWDVDANGAEGVNLVQGDGEDRWRSIEIGRHSDWPTAEKAL